MKNNLAEQLLAKTLNWDTPTAKDEIGRLSYLAAVKYDHYRNFEPGKRFLESLILWLGQFKTTEERQTAYKFVINRMLYISEVQMDHLLDILYPQRIFPILLKHARKVENISNYQIKKIRTSKSFKDLKRKSLFLGLSDSARMDSFRRKHALNNEQVGVSYELSEEKWKRMHAELNKWIEKNGLNSQPLFENIFLIDDFTGSGNSILRFDTKDNKYKGKLVKFISESLGNAETPGPLGKWCNNSGANVFVITCLATQKAMEHLRKITGEFLKSLVNPKLQQCKILDPLQIFEDYIKIPQSGNKDDLEYDQLLEKYYDDRVEDEHTITGGYDLKHGYAGCGLPLVLGHNCPNNAIYLLWAQTDGTEERPGLKALFPRIARHMEER